MCHIFFHNEAGSITPHIFFTNGIFNDAGSNTQHIFFTMNPCSLTFAVDEFLFGIYIFISFIYFIFFFFLFFFFYFFFLFIIIITIIIFFFFWGGGALFGVI